MITRSKRASATQGTTRKATQKTKQKPKRQFDARPDTVDFRDAIFVPTLVEVPTQRSVEEYRERYRRATGGSNVPILDQGEEGACTGFGLAAVCNYLLGTRSFGAEHARVSARMFYEIAKRYDEWPGTHYDGSSARGAMKGWHKHGVCLGADWPYDTKKPDTELTNVRAEKAADRPLGAYFRVNHKDIVAMHAAIAEVGILYATADVHDGWDEVGSNGIITYKKTRTGGHAFAIVGYDATGFWIQNSWAASWGKHGFGHVSYADWLANGFDVWVARLGAPIHLDDVQVLGDKQGALRTAKVSFSDLRGHIISIGNDGALREQGTYGTTKEDVQRIFATTIPEVTKDWKKPRILLYAHGGLVPEQNAIQRVQDYLKPLLEAEIYPVAFIWKTDLWTTIKDILEDSVQSRTPEERVGGAKDFLLDRLDDTLERVARLLGGAKIWGEMKENAALASLRANGGARLAAQSLANLLGSSGRSYEVHVAGHSAGSIFMGPLVQLLTSPAGAAIPADSLKDETGQQWDPINGLGLTIETCTLWAAACTTGLFKATYMPAIKNKSLAATALFSLTGGAELDDNCASIYHKSLLYLVSNAFEKEPRKFFKKDGWPILGMEKFVQSDADLQKLIKAKSIDFVLAPNTEPEGSINASCASHHGDFDDDKPTVKATLARILGKAKVADGQLTFERSARSTSERRQELFRRVDLPSM